MNLNLKNKVIIVTGGAKGIGLGISKVLVQEGALVAIVGRNDSDNQKAIQELRTLGSPAFAVVAELKNPEDCQIAVKAVVDHFGKLDGLVNNAGVNDGIGLENGNYDAFVESLHKNLVHYYLMAHFALPHLKQSMGASIVNIGSKVAQTGQGETSGYAASNGGRNALTREWAVELLPYCIRVNAVIVAECMTPLYQTWLSNLENPTQKLQNITAKIPLEKRMTTAEEIASMVAFLLSDRSSHTTGQLIHVDGGYVHLDRSLS
jgi:L-fucose dehydrogenase